MLYKQKKDYRRAIEFWEKRVQLGGIDEAWLAKAQERIELLRQVVPELRQEYLKQEAERFARELSEKQKAKRLKELAEARRLFSEARELYQKTEYEKALNSINLALALNTEDNELVLRLKDEINTKLVEQERKARIAKVNSLFDEARELYQKTEYEKALNSINLALALNIEDDEPLITLKNEINAKIIEQKKQARIAQMERYFKSAMTHYQQDNLEEAQRELDKIATEITSETSQ
jgi:tetratricopeptide (TPR) repeat protein